MANLLLTGWRVNEWHHVSDIRRENAIKHAFVSVLQAHQVDVAIQVGGTTFEKNQAMLQLFFLTLDGSWQQAVNAKHLTLLTRKAQTLRIKLKRNRLSIKG